MPTTRPPVNTPDTASNTPEHVGPRAGYSHTFHAEAHVLSGDLRAPIRQEIERHAPVSLHDERGGHLTRFTEDASIEGLIHFKTGHTRVSGSPSLKHGAWVTLSTSVLEGLNVFEILTADRVVSQVSTEHPYEDGHVPRVTFLGTKFENLRVCGFPVEVTLDLQVCGDKPDRDRSYLTKLELLNETRNRVVSILETGYLPSRVQGEYHMRLVTVDDLIARCRNGVDVTDEVAYITCSLVKKISVKHGDQIPGLRTIGNVLVIPDFGAVLLGEIEVGTERPNASNGFRRNGATAAHHADGTPKMSNYFTVTMLNMELGCVGDGSVKAAQSKTNGTTNP